MQEAVFALLADAGARLQTGVRSYRPRIALDGFEVKILKPQNIIEMLAAGSRDVGFAGADWVEELGVDLIELVDTGFDPVRLVAAAPRDLLIEGRLPRGHLVVASEYRNLTHRWLEARAQPFTYVPSFGATEVFPPEDADCIIDNTATGSTLRANDLCIVDEILCSSTRLYASPQAMEDPARRAAIDTLTLLIESVLEGRRRVMIELNVGEDQLEAIMRILPCMRQPTIARLHGDVGFAVKAAVPRSDLPNLIPLLKAEGGTDLLTSSLSQIVP